MTKRWLHIFVLAILSGFSTGMSCPAVGMPSPDFEGATIGKRESPRIAVAQQAPPEPLPGVDEEGQEMQAPPEPLPGDAEGQAPPEPLPGVDEEGQEMQ